MSDHDDAQGPATAAFALLALWTMASYVTHRAYAASDGALIDVGFLYWLVLLLALWTVGVLAAYEHRGELRAWVGRLGADAAPGPDELRGEDP